MSKLLSHFYSLHFVPMKRTLRFKVEFRSHTPQLIKKVPSFIFFPVRKANVALRVLTSFSSEPNPRQKEQEKIIEG